MNKYEVYFTGFMYEEAENEQEARIKTFDYLRKELGFHNWKVKVKLVSPDKRTEAKT